MLTALVASLLIPSADACSFMGPEPHVIDPEEVEVDTAPPDPVSSPTAEVVMRGKGADCEPDGSCVSTSCDDIGIVEVRFSPATDDRSPPEAIGYRLILVEGELADGMSLSEEAVLAPENMISIIWVDGESDVQEPLDFTLGIIPVDLGGNEGEVVTVEVSHIGGDGDEADEPGSTGCSSAPLAATLLGSLLSLGVALRRRSADHRP